MIQISTNEDEAALPGLPLLPGSYLGTEAPAEEHVHTLEDEFPIHPLDSQNSLVPEQIFAFALH